MGPLNGQNEDMSESNNNSRLSVMNPFARATSIRADAR